MEVSCHPLIHMVKLAKPLMQAGMRSHRNLLGSEEFMEGYNVMGPVKAALESCVRYMAAELGPIGIRVHALSPGPLKTRAASGIDHFDSMLERIRERTPEHHTVTIEDVKNVATFLASDAAAALTGNVEYIDAGYHIVG